MKKLGILILLAGAGAPAHCQTTPTALPDSVAGFLDRSLTLLQTYSLERNTVDWPQLRQTAYQRADSPSVTRSPAASPYTTGD